MRNYLGMYQFSPFYPRQLGDSRGSTLRWGRYTSAPEVMVCLSVALLSPPHRARLTNNPQVLQGAREHVRLITLARVTLHGKGMGMIFAWCLLNYSSVYLLPLMEIK